MTTETTQAADPAVVLDEIRQREQAATPGPWGWYGNTETQDIYLATKAFGRSYVMRFARWGMRNAKPLFAVGRKWGPDPHYGGEMTITPHGRLTGADDLAVYEVAPDAVSRTDPRVYRTDVTGIRHPDAVFIADAREDVRRLLKLADSVLALAGEWRTKAAALDAKAERCEADVLRSTLLSARGQAHDDLAEELRQAAVAALLGEAS